LHNNKSLTLSEILVIIIKRNIANKATQPATY
jgi:hypothetical protein